MRPPLELPKQPHSLRLRRVPRRRLWPNPQRHLWALKHTAIGDETETWNVLHGMRNGMRNGTPHEQNGEHLAEVVRRHSETLGSAPTALSRISGIVNGVSNVAFEA